MCSEATPSIGFLNSVHMGIFPAMTEQILQGLAIMQSPVLCMYMLKSPLNSMHVLMIWLEVHEMI